MWKKHTDVSSVLSLVKIVVASQHKKRQRKNSLSTFVDNWKNWLQMSYSYASHLPFKNVCKLAKQAGTIKNRFWLWLSIVWETRKLTLYQPEVKFSYITFLYRTLPKVYALARADIIHSQREIKEIFDPENSPFH